MEEIDYFVGYSLVATDTAYLEIFNCYKRNSRDKLLFAIVN